MCVIDSYLLYTACIGRQESPDTYYSKLAEELIDSRKITRVQQELMARADEAEAGTKRQSLGTASGVGPHLTPNKRKKPSPGKEAGKGGKEFTNHTSQVRCMTCKTKTTWLCSLCIDVGKTRGVCHTKTRVQCWEAHMKEEHDTRLAIPFNIERKTSGVWKLKIRT